MRLIESQKTGMLEQQAQNAVRQKTFYFVVKNYELDFSTNVEMSHISNLEKIEVSFYIYEKTRMSLH